MVLPAEDSTTVIYELPSDGLEERVSNAGSNAKQRIQAELVQKHLDKTGHDVLSVEGSLYAMYFLRFLPKTKGFYDFDDPAGSAAKPRD